MGDRRCNRRKLAQMHHRINLELTAVRNFDHQDSRPVAGLVLGILHPVAGLVLGIRHPVVVLVLGIRR